eukprot:7014480-Prymnesium_polylepis.1
MRLAEGRHDVLGGEDVLKVVVAAARSQRRGLHARKLCAVLVVAAARESPGNAHCVEDEHLREARLQGVVVGALRRDVARRLDRGYCCRAERGPPEQGPEHIFSRANSLKRQCWMKGLSFTPTLHIVASVRVPCLTCSRPP